MALPLTPLQAQVVENIKKIRARKNLTQAGLAQQMGLTQSGIKNFEGGRIPGAEDLISLANIGEVTVDWILGREIGDRPAESLQQHEIKEASSQEDKRIRNLILKFREQANLSTKRHLAKHLDVLLKVKVDE